MSFSGTWNLSDQEGYEAFMTLMGVPANYVQAGKSAPVILRIEQNGDHFTVETSTGPQSWTDKFEIGKPAKITGPGKKQMETVVRLEGGKLLGEYQVPGATIQACREVDGDLLYDVLSLANVTFKRTFKRQ